MTAGNTGLAEAGYNSAFPAASATACARNTKGDEMTEQDFTDELIREVEPSIVDARIKSGMSVLYEMPIDDDGKVHMGVDQDSGEAIRGKGTGFEQDILVFEEKSEGQTTVVPRVIAEVKYDAVTTHDAIVYSYKAECIKRIYPFVRFGMVIGAFKSIPGRVLRLGKHFDFVVAIQYPLVPSQITELRTLLNQELAASRALGAMLNGRAKPRIVHRLLTMQE